jgi:hypothetical protein
MDPIPIVETIPNPVPFLRAANALENDERVRTWFRKKDTALEEKRAKRRTYNAAARIMDYPRHELESLKGQLDRVRGARKAMATAMATEATGLVDRDTLRASEVVTNYLRRPDGVDATVDALELQEERRRLKEMDPAKLAVVIPRVAEEGQHRLTLRAALATPRAGDDPLVPEAVAREARAWIVTKQASDVVRNLETARRLRRLAQEFALAEYQLALE